MNTRIRELLTQAGVGDNWNEADWYSLSPEMLQKFTELIIRECANIAFNGGDKVTSAVIQMHFGVEE